MLTFAIPFGNEESSIEIFEIYSYKKKLKKNSKFIFELFQGGRVRKEGVYLRK